MERLMSYWAKAALLPTLALVVLSCGGSTGPDVGPSPFDSCTPNTDPDLSALGTDAVNLQVANEQPGFAGLRIQGDKIEVSVAIGYAIDVDGYRSSIIKHVGFRVFQGNGRLRSMEFRRVTFPWPELVLAKNTYGDCLLFTDGVVSLGISETENRVVVGVVDQIMRNHVLRFVANDGDKFLVEIERIPSFSGP
jgi:hypothetical protein